jgi:hypothetical protein
MNDQSDIQFTRLNNKLGGWGLLDGSLTPDNWNGASFRSLTPVEDLDLDLLVQQFPQLHLRAQERIFAMLLQLTPTQLEPIRDKVSSLLAIHRVNPEHANASKDELLSATWLPRLAEAAAEAHGFLSEGTTNIIDQDAANILAMLPPVRSSPNEPHAEVTMLQQAQDLQWQLWHQSNEGKKAPDVDLEPVRKHLAKVGLTRHFPYEVLIGGRHPNDIIKTYQITIPPVAQQMLTTKTVGTDVNFTHKDYRPKLTFKISGGSAATESSLSSSSSSSSSSTFSNTTTSNPTSNTTTSNHISDVQRQQQAEAARKRAAAEKLRKAAQVKANLESVLAAGQRAKETGNKRPRQMMEANKAQPSSSSSSINAAKKPAIASAAGQPAANPQHYNPSDHESKYNEYINLIRENAPAKRVSQILANVEFVFRMKDFATGAPTLHGKVDPKTGQPKVAFPINLKIFGGELWALVFNYKELTYGIKKKKREGKRKK